MVMGSYKKYDKAQRHDTVFKLAMRDLKVSRAMIEDYLPCEITKHLNLDTLATCQASYVDKDLKHTHADMLYKVQSKLHNETYIYFLWEHQSTYDKRIALRLLQYTCNIMQDHLDSGGKGLPVVIPALVYNGVVSPYPGSCQFMHAFTDSSLAEATMFKSFHLVDLSVKSNEDLVESTWSALPNLILKHMRARDFLHEVQAHFLPLIKFLYSQGGETMIENMLECIIQFTNITDKSEFITTVGKTMPDSGDKLMTIYEQLISEGMEKGLQLGRQEGRQEGRQLGRKAGQAEAKQLVVKNLILEGFASAQIAKLVSVNISDVEIIKSAMIAEAQ